jgi:hypothetical protein
MQNQYLSLNNSKRLVLIASLSILLALTGLLGGGALADTNFDTSDTYSSAGTGIGQANGQTGPNIGNTNVSFSDFGNFTRNPYPGGDTSNPADLLPINQQNTTTTGLPINSYQATSIYKPGVQSGTSPTQAPVNTGQIYPFGGARGSLPPVSSGLQATMMQNAFLPITSGTSTDYSHYSFGFNSTPYNLYSPSNLYGAYGQPVPIPNPLGSIGLGNSNSLPPTSLGSVDFNIRSK